MNVQKAIFCGARAVQPGQKITPFGLKEITGSRGNTLAHRKTIHVTAQVKYPEARNIPLPNNIEAIMSIEIGQFSPQRSRDISGPVMFSQQADTFERHHNQMPLSKSFNQFVESYDCQGVCSLNSSMQSNVPQPFQSKGNVMHLNMPGGQWEQGYKFVAEDIIEKSHYAFGKKKPGIRMFHTLSTTDNNKTISAIVQKRFESTKTVDNNNNNNNKDITEKALSRKDKLKRAVAEYGTTVIVFHVGISLISLGACYTLVSSGLDMATIISYLPWIDGTSSKLTQNASTFVTAYAIHKLMAPIRISITLTSVPFIVRYLRKIGFLKRR